MKAAAKEKKERNPSIEKISAEEIRKLVAKFLKEQATNTNPKKAPPRLLHRAAARPRPQALGGDSPCAGVYE